MEENVEIQINLKIMKGGQSLNDRSVKILKSTPVDELKRIIDPEVDIRLMRLIHQGHVLHEGSQSVGFYNINDASTIHVIIRDPITTETTSVPEPTPNPHQQTIPQGHRHVQVNAVFSTIPPNANTNCDHSLEFFRDRLPGRLWQCRACRRIAQAGYHCTQCGNVFECESCHLNIEVSAENISQPQTSSFDSPTTTSQSSRGNQAPNLAPNVQVLRSVMDNLQDTLHNHRRMYPNPYYQDVTGTPTHALSRELTQLHFLLHQLEPSLLQIANRSIDTQSGAADLAVADQLRRLSHVNILMADALEASHRATQQSNINRTSAQRLPENSRPNVIPGTHSPMPAAEPVNRPCHRVTIRTPILHRADQAVSQGRIPQPGVPLVVPLPIPMQAPNSIPGGVSPRPDEHSTRNNISVSVQRNDTTSAPVRTEGTATTSTQNQPAAQPPSISTIRIPIPTQPSPNPGNPAHSNTIRFQFHMQPPPTTRDMEHLDRMD